MTAERARRAGRRSPRPAAARSRPRSASTPALVVVRNGRVVHHELDAALEAKGVHGVRHRHVRAEPTSSRGSASCSDASPDAFTVLHDAFLAGGAFVQVPAGVVVEQPIVVLHWSEGDGLASFPHTLVVAGEGAEVTVLDRYGSPDTAAATGHLVDAVVELVVGDNAHVRYVSRAGARPAHLADRAAAGAPRPRRDRCASSAVALGGDYARLRSESLLDGQGAESDLIAVYFGDGTQMLDFRTLQDHDAPRTRSDLLFKGAVEDTARSVYSGLIRIRPDAQKVERVPDEPQPRAHRGRRARSRSRTSRSRPTTCGARTRAPSARSTTTSSTTSRPAACRPRRRSGSSCSASSTTCSTRLPVPSLVAPLRRSVIEKIEHRDRWRARA